ncbi:hypothetical protein FGB62_7g453 [Gracilaria domingensis]|nr:hypothetical protein FGB62_7g453 [Gracilaria domingensis]
MTKPFFYSAAEDVILLRIILSMRAHLIGADEISSQTRPIALPQDVTEIISKAFQNEVRTKISPKHKRTSISLRGRYVRLLEHYASDTLPQDNNEKHSRERENLLKLIIQERAAMYANEDHEDSPPPDETFSAEDKDPDDLFQSSPQMTNIDKIHVQSERQRRVFLEFVASNEREHREFISDYSDMLSDICAQQETELQASEAEHQARLEKYRNEISIWKKRLIQFEEEHKAELAQIQ